MKKILLVALIIFISSFCLAASVKKLESNHLQFDDDNLFNVCVFQDSKGLFCKHIRTEQGCLDYAKDNNLRFVKFSQYDGGVEDPLGAIECYNNPNYSEFSNEITDRKLRDLNIHSPLKIVIYINDDIFKYHRSEITTNIILMILFFIIPFAFLVFLKLKLEILSFPIILFFSLTFLGLGVNILDIFSGRQFFVVILDNLYSISSLLYFVIFLFSVLYMIVTPTYHYWRFKNNILTDQMLAFIIIIDKIKNKMNL